MYECCVYLCVCVCVYERTHARVYVGVRVYIQLYITPLTYTGTSQLAVINTITCKAYTIYH